MNVRQWTLVLLLCVFAVDAGAQTRPDDMPAAARYHLGPLKLNPTIALSNMGVDNNVFNAADTEQPKTDMTLTLTPRSDAWIQFGRAWVTGSMSEDLVYYRTFASERSVNSTYRGNLWLPLNRTTVTLGTGYLSTRDRPGYEIDARSRHSEADVHGSVEVRAFGKTKIGVSAERTRIAFEPDAMFLGRSLRNELNRTTTMGEVSVRHALTPVTQLMVIVAREQDRFEFSPLRDSDSTRVVGTLKFHARLAGSASFGYRDFQPLDGRVPTYVGPTANVDMSVRPFGATRIGVQVNRDLQYSFETEQPYYVETGTGLSVTQGLSGRYDIVGRYGIQHLGYQGRIGSSAALLNRADVIHWFGGGIGYRVGRDMRIGFNVDKQRRTSDFLQHGYDGLRFGTSVTYGL